MHPSLSLLIFLSMANYYECRFKAPNAEGKPTVTYALVDAYDFTGAEQAIRKYYGVDNVLSISHKASIKEVLEDDVTLATGNDYYVAKVADLMVDDKGNTKKIRYRVITQGPSPSEAAKNVEQQMEQGYGMIVESCEKAKFENIIIW